MNARDGRSLSSLTAEILTDLFRDGLDVRLRLRGGSMKPLVPSGSLLCFSPCGEPSIGDVVLARLPNDSLVAHRVVALDSARIWTKGDSCRSMDGPLSHESILARAVRLEGTIPLPLSSVWMRALGLLLNRFYPRWIARCRALLQRPPREGGS